jgi:hypothetical protein
LTLARVGRELQARGYRTHEFGDSVFVERRQGTRSAPIRGEGQRVTARRSQPAIAPQPLTAAPR